MDTGGQYSFLRWATKLFEKLAIWLKKGFICANTRAFRRDDLLFFIYFGDRLKSDKKLRTPTR